MMQLLSKDSRFTRRLFQSLGVLLPSPPCSAKRGGHPSVRACSCSCYCRALARSIVVGPFPAPATVGTADPAMGARGITTKSSEEGPTVRPRHTRSNIVSFSVFHLETICLNIMRIANSLRYRDLPGTFCGFVLTGACLAGDGYSISMHVSDPSPTPRHPL